MPITAIVNASGVSARLEAGPGASASVASERGSADPQRPSERAGASSGLRQFKVLQSRSGGPAQLTLAFPRD